MKLAVYNDIVQLFRSLRWNDFAVQSVAQKYLQWVFLYRIFSRLCLVLVIVWEIGLGNRIMLLETLLVAL